MAKGNPLSMDIDVTSLIAEVQKAISGTNDLRTAEEKLLAVQKKVENQIKKLAQAQKELNETRNIVASINRLETSLNQIQTALKKVGDNSTGASKGFKTMEEALKSININLDGFKEKSTNIGKDSKITQYTNGLNQLVTVTQKGSGATATYTAKVKTLNTEVKQSTKHIKNAAFATENWSYNWAKAMQSFLTYNTVTQFFNTIMNSIHDMINEVKELDDALVELQKVTDLEGDSLERFVEEAYAAGETVAKTGTEMIEAATAFAKAGYKDNSLELGTVAAMYTNIADEAIDAADAADMIIAQMKAFNITAEDSIHIIDAINEVSNNFAVSSADISRNLGKASAVMANAGNSMEQYIGLMTAATEVTRNANKAANGLKTLTLRLQGMNDEGQEDLEVQAQMEELFQKLGISVYKANGELKNTYEILETLAPVYQNLTNAEKAYVTETIAGKYQAQNAAAILNNWATAVDATTTAMNSNGSAAKENEKVLNSIQGHLQKLSSAWEEFSKKIFNSEFIKFIVDLGTWVLKLANSGFGQLAIKVSLFIISMNLIKTGVMAVTNQFKNLIVKMAGGTTQAIKLSAANTKLAASYKLVKQSATGSATGIDTATASMKKAEVSTIATGTAFKTAGKNMLSGLASFATSATGIATIAFTAISLIVAKQNELHDKAIESAKNATESAKAINEETQAYRDSKEEIEELRSKLDSGNLSSKEAYDARKRLSEIEDELKKKYGDEASALDLINGKYEDQITLLDKTIKKKQENWIIENKSDLKKAENYMNAKHNWGVTLKGLDDKSLDIFEGKGINFQKDGATRDEAYEYFSNLSKKIEEYGKQWGLTDKQIEQAQANISETLKKIKNDDYNTWKELLDQQTEVKIGQNDKYYEYAKEIEKAANNYKEAKLSGDEEAMQTSLENLQKLQEELDKVVDGKNDKDVKDYFKNVFEGYKQDIQKAELKKWVKQEVDDGTGLLLGTIQEIKKKLGKEQITITDILNTKGSKDILGFNYLETQAGRFGLTIEDLLVLFSNYGVVVNDLKNTNSEFGNTFANADTTLKTFSENMSNIATSYDKLTSAAEEFNENGYITIDTFKGLMDNNLWQYFQWTADGINANTDALINEADAAKYNALVALQDAFAKDALAIATNDVTNQSNIAKSAVAGLKDEMDAAGLIAQARAGNLFTYAGAVQAIKDAEAGKDLSDSDIEKKSKQLQNLTKAYNNAAQGIANINLQASAKKSGSGSGGSSSKSEKEWWEQELDALKDQYDNNEITINEYINSLQNLLGKVGQGTEAWKKINKELQKQKLDKIKDDYNAGRISLNQYIISLQNLQKEYKQSTKEWNSLADAIKKAKLDQLKEQQNDLKSALSAVNNTLEKQIEDYENLKDAADERYDDELDRLGDLQDALNDKNDDYERAQKAVVDFLNEQLDAINEQRDTVENYYDDVINAIEKMNEDTKESIELAEAYDALMNAMTQKTKKVYKEGLGWIWTTDAEAIKNAKKTYDDLVKSATTKEIEEQKDKAVNSLEEQIEALQNYIDSWDKVFDKFDNEKNRNLADILLGENWSEMVSNLDPQIVDDFSDAYYELQKNLDETAKQIEELNKQKEEEDEYWDKLIKDLQDYKGEWSDIANVYEEAQNALKAKQIMGANWEKEILDRRLDVLENFKNKYNAILAEIDKVDNMSTDEASGYTALRLPGYANGGEVDYTGLAVLHGTPNKPEYVLNNAQMRNLLGNLTRPRTTSAINNKNSGAVINNYSFGDIELPNVTNAQQFANELKSMLNITKNQ